MDSGEISKVFCLMFSQMKLEPIPAGVKGKFVMGGRFGKYGDLKRKAALRRSRKKKRRLQKELVPRGAKKRKTGREVPKK